MMITYRTASGKDAVAIAMLHARNWQLYYASFLTEDYLENQVVEERKRVWQQRMEQPADNQHVIVAEQNDQLIGFACTFLNEDERWGGYLDNLHVDPDFKGKGVGRELMRLSVQWVLANEPSSSYYLWVIDDNKQAIKFYERLGGKQEDMHLHTMPDGSKVNALRYVWTDLKVLLG